MKRIAIIGAGISGLTAARFLKDLAEITLFEKARGPSGRVSTRREDPYAFDHGAQYFTARTKPFQDFIQPLLNDGIISRWNAKYVRLNGNQIVERRNWADEEPRYVGVPGMNQVGKYLANGLDIRYQRRIVSIENTDKWALTDTDVQEFSNFDWVISTVPAPQALELLPHKFKHYEEIKAIEMKACFSLMLALEDSLPLEFEAAHVSNSVLSWIAVNSHKPERPENYTLLVHSSEEYAETHLHDDREKLMQELIEETSRIIGHDLGGSKHMNLHGWHFANNADRNQLSHPFIDTKQKLAACGDWCLGGRVEGAFTSAYNLANEMIKRVL
jgi:renalase